MHLRRHKLGVPSAVLSTTRRQPITFWRGHPELWEYLPGTVSTPPALRARLLGPPPPPAAAAHGRDGGSELGEPARLGGGRTQAEFPWEELPAGVEDRPLPLEVVAKQEADYIKRLYAVLVKKHPDGIPVRAFSRRVG